MVLKERTVIDKAEVLRDGSIQVREAKEIYDTQTDEVIAQEYHRYVVGTGSTTPTKVQEFLDNSKG